ncbi:MAG: rod shape-determining protein MreD [Alphaproteobacteria bacterium]|nr:rod shape-determining protein MreD [Alphaproteobacteria bacterium]
MARQQRFSNGFVPFVIEGAVEIFPMVTVILFSILEQAHLPFLGSFQPAVRLGFLAVCFWSLSRPTSMPVLVVFILGLVHDAVQGLPIGLSSTLWILTSQLLVLQRRTILAQSLVVEMMIVLIVVILFVFVQSIVTLVLFEKPLFFGQDLLVIAQTIVFYPLLLVLFARMTRRTRGLIFDNFD